MAAIDIDSVANVKLYMGISDSSYDSLLGAWVTEVSGLIEQRISQPVNSIAKTDYLNGSNSSILYMKSGRIISLVGDTEATRLASLQYRNSATEAFADLLTDEDLIYIASQENDTGWTIELLDFNIFPGGQKNIKVVYNCGFSPVPPDLKKVLKEMVQVMWDESKQGGISRLGMSAANRGASGSSLSDTFIDMDVRWARTLDGYRRII